VVCGEVGLAGEVRAIGHMDMRVREAERLGFTRCMMPKGNRDRGVWKSDMELLSVATIQEVFGYLFNGKGPQ
jgi:DNA repair protein RadA/Sms